MSEITKEYLLKLRMFRVHEYFRHKGIYENIILSETSDDIITASQEIGNVKKSWVFKFLKNKEVIIQVLNVKQERIDNG